VRKNKIDVILLATRNAMVQWWIEKTHVRPNKSEVTRKRLGPCIYDEKATHFLTKTQVYIYFLIC
jgi:hypothetical protein